MLDWIHGKTLTLFHGIAQVVPCDRVEKCDMQCRAAAQELPRTGHLYIETRLLNTVVSGHCHSSLEQVHLTEPSDCLLPCFGGPDLQILLNYLRLGWGSLELLPLGLDVG